LATLAGTMSVISLIACSGVFAIWSSRL
jgi:hypothetical protein